MAISACIFGSLPATDTYAKDDIGVAAAVKPAAHGQRPEKTQRVLQVGIDMIRNERITTKPEGRAQILFRDGTTLTVGPNSDITLDEFVYDDETSTGKLVMSTTKGLLRLVGGKISKKTPIKIKTPTATVGIRGGITIVETTPDGQTDAIFLFGKDMTVETDGKQQVAVRPNTQIRVANRNAGPSQPVVNNNPETLSNTLGRLEAPRDEPSAVDVVVVNEAFKTSSIEQFGSSQGATNLAPPAKTPPPPPMPGDFAEFEERTEQQTAFNNNQPPPGANAGSFTVSGLIRQSVDPLIGGEDGMIPGDEPYTNGILTATDFTLPPTLNVNGTLPIAPGAITISGADPNNNGQTVSGTGFFDPGANAFFYELSVDAMPNVRSVIFGGTPASSIPTTGRTRYGVRRDHLLDSDYFFMRQDRGGDVAVLANDGDAFITWDDSAANAQRSFGVTSLGIEGMGASQRSVFSIAAGKVEFDNSGRPFLTGEQFGSARIDGLDPFVSTGAVASVDDGFGNDFFGTGPEPSLIALDSAFTDGNDVKVGNGIVSNTRNGAIPPEFYNPFNILTRDNNQTIVNPITTESLEGFTAGFAETYDSAGGLLERIPIVSDNEPIPGVGTDFDFTLDKDSATNKVFVTLSVDESIDETASIAVIGISLPLGDEPTTFGHSAFYDDGTYVARHNDDFSLPPTVNGQTPLSTVAGLVSVDGPDHFINALPPGTTLCSCPFLRWGFWSTEILEVSENGIYVHLASWVAGTPAQDTEIAALSGASVNYNGHISASVRDGPDGSQSLYNAVGDISMTYTFGAMQNGTVTVSDFDGATFGGSVASPPGQQARFSGTLSGGRLMTLRGAFFEGGGEINAQAGGQVTVEGVDYFASGIFAMDKAP